MPSLITTLSLCFSALLSFLWSISPFTYYTPQLLAILFIIFFFLFKHLKSYLLNLISLLLTLIVFATGGLNSPVFFLIYFLLFTIAFQNPPSITLSYSLVLIFLLSQSLNSLPSLLPLSSLLLVTPLAWFIGHQYLDNQKLDHSLSQDETDIFLWHSLKFKTGIGVIIDAASQLLSTPLTPSQKNHAQKIHSSAKSLLHSSSKLTSAIDRATDES